MILGSLYNNADKDEPQRSMYDPDPLAEEDLWFLPAPDHEDPDPDPAAPPLPQANRRGLVDMAAWAQAEAALARPLAEVSARLGALDERLRCAPEGWTHRLALKQAAALSWFGAERISVERLSLWQMLRLAGPVEDTQSLLRADWAVRRLARGPAMSLSAPDDITSFLERQDLSANAAASLREVEKLSDQVSNWCEVMKGAGGLHPVTRAAFGLHLWPIAGLTENRIGGDIEALVLAMCLAVAGLPGGLRFLPLSEGGLARVFRGGTPENRLSRFLDCAEVASLAALRHLDQLVAWQDKAQLALKSKSGRTPGQLMGLFADWPLVSAPMAEQHTGASRATIHRHLDAMTELGLIREITGQGRYRVWAIAEYE